MAAFVYLYAYIKLLIIEVMDLSKVLYMSTKAILQFTRERKL